MTKIISQLVTTIDNNKNIATAATAFAEAITGENNIAIGAGAAANVVTTKNSVFIGTNTGLASAETTGQTIENAIAIGHGATVNNSNSIVLGNGCNVGIGTTDPKHALHLSTGDNDNVSPVIYIDSSTPPTSASITNNAGVFSVTTGVATFTSSDSKKSGAIIIAKQNSTCGKATLDATATPGIASITISNTAVTTSSIISVTRNVGASSYPETGIENFGHLFVGSISNGSFTIYSTVSTDVGIVDWVIINPQQ